MDILQRLQSDLDHMETRIDQIQELQSYKQILDDSFGGIMYNVANKSKYDTTKILELWNRLTPSEQEHADGIMKGAINFIK
jgi:hypothetical protein